MNLSERIKQLERRIQFLKSEQESVRKPDKITTRSLNLSARIGNSIRICEGQIQALRWVESNRQYYK